MPKPIPQAGAPDPSLRTSPIFDENEDELSLDLGLETGVCYFNGESFALGDYVASGNEILHCEERGVWARAGETAPAKDIG